jgi:hypothetical protein
VKETREKKLTKQDGEFAISHTKKHNSVQPPKHHHQKIIALATELSASTKLQSTSGESRKEQGYTSL